MRHRTRVCAFLADLAAIPDRTPALVEEVRVLSGVRVSPELSFVGFRQSRPVHGNAPSYQPYVTNRYGVTRLANTALRLAGVRLAPRAAAAAALKVCGPAFVEAVLACDPELVLIDVRWGDALAALLERELPGAVFVVGSAPPGRRFVRRRSDPSPARVSIVLPTYNGSRYIGQSLASCLEQSHPNIEVIVVDDGSRDDMAAAVGRFGDGRVRYVRHATNRGLPAALNTGFSHATGELLTWTSDDNYYAPDAIERMAAFLVHHPDIAFVYASMFIVEDCAEVAPRVRPALPPGALHHQNGVGACFLYTREVYRTVGEYNAGAALVEDYDYWVRVSKRFRMQRLNAPLYYYRHHDGSLTSQHGADAVAVRFDLVRQQNGLA